MHFQCVSELIKYNAIHAKKYLMQPYLRAIRILESYVAPSRFSFITIVWKSIFCIRGYKEPLNKEIFCTNSFRFDESCMQQSNLLIFPAVQQLHGYISFNGKQLNEWIKLNKRNEGLNQ